MDLMTSIEFAAWGYLENDNVFNINNKTLIIKKGYYLMAYKTTNGRVHLFWGPGRCSWTHNPGGSIAGTENLIGKEFGDNTKTDAGNRVLACQWMDSWTSISDQEVGQVRLFSSSNGEYVIGLTGVGIPDDVALYDLCTFKIKDETIIHDYYNNRWGGKPGDKNDIILSKMLGRNYGGGFMFIIDLCNFDPRMVDAYYFNGASCRIRFSKDTFDIFRR